MAGNSTAMGAVRRKRRIEAIKATKRADAEAKPGNAKQIRPATRRRRKMLAAAIVLLCLATATYCGYMIWTSIVLAQVDQGYTRHLEKLTEDEASAWRTAVQEPGVAYMQLNAQVQVQNGIGDIRLINPPYSGYSISVSISAEDTVLFSHDEMMPGSLMDTAEFAPLEKGSHDAVATFTFFDGRGRLKKQSETRLTVNYID